MHITALPDLPAWTAGLRVQRREQLYLKFFGECGLAGLARQSQRLRRTHVAAYCFHVHSGPRSDAFVTGASYPLPQNFFRFHCRDLAIRHGALLRPRPVRAEAEEDRKCITSR